MSVYDITFILLGLLLFLLGSGMWIALALGLTGVIGLMAFTPFQIGDIVALQTWNRASIYVLAAVPMFVLCAEFLIETKLSKWLFDGLAPWMVWLPGRLLHTNVVGCAFMAGITGSSTADAMTIGRINYTQLASRGYDSKLTAGSLAAAGTLGILIPPSIVPIIFASVVGGSVGQMFLAGVIPGILVAFLFSSWIALRAIFEPSIVPPTVEPYTWRDRWWGLVLMSPTLGLVFFILGSLYIGFATPTEAAGLSAAAAFVVGVSTKSLDRYQFFRALVSTCRLTSFIMLIIVGATILGAATAYVRLPAAIVSSLTYWTNNDIYIVLLLLSVIYILLGMFLDPNSVVLLTLPVVVPMMDALGVNRVWFCVYLIIMVEMANITPPVGFNLFVMQGVSGLNVRAISIAALPFVAILAFTAFVLAMFPDLALWLPRLVYGKV